MCEIPNEPSWSAVMWRTSNDFMSILVSSASVSLLISHSSLAAARHRHRCQPDAERTLSLWFGFNHPRVDYVPGHHVPGFGPGCPRRPRNRNGLDLGLRHRPGEVDMQQPIVQPGAFHVDPLGEHEGPLELPRGD